MVDGLRDCGLEVWRAGLGPTPMLYFATLTLRARRGGIMITGSHNPPDQNGFKMMLGKAAFYGAAIQELGRDRRRRRLRLGAAWRRAEPAGVRCLCGTAGRRPRPTAAAARRR